MKAAAISDVGQDLASAGQPPVRAGVVEIPLARVATNRIGILDEIDRQLSLFSSAAAGACAPPPAGVMRTHDVPLKKGEIVVSGQRGDQRWPAPDSGREFRVVAVTAALLVTLGLGWFGAPYLVRFFDRPAELTGKAAVEAVVKRIIATESGGGANAKNKNSSATGYGQFIDDTWLELIRAHRPDLAKGRGKDETLELRREAKLAHEITMRFAERNARLLNRRGLPVTAGTVYLAHFAGGAGAVAILSAPADADAALVMARADATGRTKREQIVKANPFLERFTVADLKLWADRKMQGQALHLTELLAASAKK